MSRNQRNVAKPLDHKSEDLQELKPLSRDAVGVAKIFVIIVVGIGDKSTRRYKLEWHTQFGETRSNANESGCPRDR
jgi:hypothetical protein